MNDSVQLSGATALIVIVGAALFAIAGHVLWALAYGRIARRAERPSWPGWVPVANVLGLFSIARMAWWPSLALIVASTVIRLIGWAIAGNSLVTLLTANDPTQLVQSGAALAVTEFLAGVLQLAAFVLVIVAIHRINGDFGVSVGFTVLAVVAPLIWILVLGFGSATWSNPEGRRIPAPALAGPGTPEGEVADRPDPGTPADPTSPAARTTFAPWNPPAIDESDEKTGPAASEPKRAAPSSPLLASIPVPPPPPPASSPASASPGASATAAVPAVPATRMPPSFVPPSPAAGPADGDPVDPNGAPEPLVEPAAPTPRPPATGVTAAIGSPWAPPPPPLTPPTYVTDPASAPVSPKPSASRAADAVDSADALGVPPLPPAREPQPSVAERPGAERPAARADVPLVEEADERTVAVTGAAFAVDDLDDHTVVVQRAPRSVLVAEGGVEFPLEADTVLLGRRPSASPAWPDAQLVSVPDSSKTISKVHAVLLRTAEGWTITDLNSTNGVVFITDEGDERLITPDIAERVTGAFALGTARVHIREGR